MTHVDLKMQQADCFKLLAACFYEPDKELFIQESLCSNLTSLLAACGLTDASTSAEEMERALVAQKTEEMEVDFSKLFVGPFELVAPPYGSAYLEKTRRLMGDSTMAVQKMYQEAGLSLEVKEAPDHIALELEFMYYLITREIQALNLGDAATAREHLETQAEFLGKYLAAWVPQFAKTIKEGTKNRYYQALAECLETFVTSYSVQKISDKRNG